MLLFAQLATVLIFAGSLILLVAAALLYVPLLCYIQGNLKVSSSTLGQSVRELIV
jgi:Ca2+/Na+ antiporter